MLTGRLHVRSWHLHKPKLHYFAFLRQICCTKLTNQQQIEVMEYGQYRMKILHWEVRRWTDCSTSCSLPASWHLAKWCWCTCACSVNISILFITRKLSYRKADRAMRPIYGCPEIFRVSLTTPTATFPENLNGLCSDWAYKYAYKIESL